MTTSVATLNKALKFAVENGNMDLVRWVFTNKEIPDNLEECITIAIEKQNQEIVTVLLSKMKPVAQPVIPRPLKVIKQIKLDMGGDSHEKNVGDNSQWMITLQIDTNKALAELEAGDISMEEINHHNGDGWTALMYLARNASLIPEAEKIIQKLLELGVNVNAADKGGWTALHLACAHIKKDSKETVVSLIWNYPKTNTKMETNYGITAIQHLVEYCRKDQYAYLKEMCIKNGPPNGKFLVRLFQRNEILAEEFLREKLVKINWLEDYNSFFNLHYNCRDRLFALIKKYE